MDNKRRDAFNKFGKGGAGMAVASRELKLPDYAVKVAGSGGIGDAVQHVRATELKRKAKRVAQKASRRRNR